MRIKLSEVPISVRRMAAQHLESLRGSGIGSNVDELYLGDLVCPIYRPDLAQVAYYEFEVMKAAVLKPELRPDLIDGVIKINLRGEEGFIKSYRSAEFPEKLLDKDIQLLATRPLQGFIMVSTNDHDHPIPHWSLEGLPPSYQLESRMTTAKAQAISHIYRLDALCYLAEDAKETQLATLGQMPSLIKGLPEKLDDYEGKISAMVQTPAATSLKVIDQAKMKPAASVKSGTKPVMLEFTAAANWPAMKKGFTTQFGPMLRHLQKRASTGAWAIEKTVRELGEGILVGKPYTVALLSPNYSLKVTGEGAQYVRVRIVTRPGQGAAAELLCTALPKQQELSFALDITYADKSKETLPFFVYGRDIPSKMKTNNPEN
jgi:hypothetical protein